MVDINTHWDLSTALRCGPELDQFDIGWLEEPMNQHDVKGHAQLQALMKAPLLVGENLTSLSLFRDFIEQRALRLAQPDVTRIGGITRWLDVAALARANNLRVVPACWDTMQVSDPPRRGHPEVHLMEHLDWTRDVFEERLRIENGSHPRARGARRRAARSERTSSSGTASRTEPGRRTDAAEPPPSEVALHGAHGPVVLRAGGTSSLARQAPWPRGARGEDGGGLEPQPSHGAPSADRSRCPVLAVERIRRTCRTEAVRAPGGVGPAPTARSPVRRAAGRPRASGPRRVRRPSPDSATSPDGRRQ